MLLQQIFVCTGRKPTHRSEVTMHAKSTRGDRCTEYACWHQKNKSLIIYSEHQLSKTYTCSWIISTKLLPPRVKKSKYFMRQLQAVFYTDYGLQCERQCIWKICCKVTQRKIMIGANICAHTQLFCSPKGLWGEYGSVEGDQRFQTVELRAVCINYSV